MRDGRAEAGAAAEPGRRGVREWLGCGRGSRRRQQSVGARRRARFGHRAGLSTVGCRHSPVKTCLRLCRWRLVAAPGVVQFAHTPATRRMRAHLAALSCRLGILLHLGHAQLFHVGFASVVSAVWTLLPVCRSHYRRPGQACSSITGAVFLWLYQEQPPLEQGLSSTPAYGRCLCMDQPLR